MGDPRLALYRQLWPEWSRSTLYEWIRANSLAAALTDAGLLDDRLRDRETRRKTKTILRELGRLEYVDDEERVSVYLMVRDHSLAEIKDMVRVVKAAARVQSLDVA